MDRCFPAATAINRLFGVSRHFVCGYPRQWALRNEHGRHSISKYGSCRIVRPRLSAFCKHTSRARTPLMRGWTVLSASVLLQESFVFTNVPCQAGDFKYFSVCFQGNLVASRSCPASSQYREVSPNTDAVIALTFQYNLHRRNRKKFSQSHSSCRTLRSIH